MYSQLTSACSDGQSNGTLQLLRIGVQQDFIGYHLHAINNRLVEE